MKGLRLLTLFRASDADGNRMLAAELPSGGYIVIEKNESTSLSDAGAPAAFLTVLDHDAEINVQGGTGYAFREVGAEGGA